MSKVIQFPNKKKSEVGLKKIEPPLNQRERTELAVQNVTSEIVGELMYILYECGYELEEDRYITHVSLIYDAIRSLLLSVEGIEHPYQDFARMIYGNEDGEMQFDID